MELLRKTRHPYQNLSYLLLAFSISPKIIENLDTTTVEAAFIIFATAGIIGMFLAQLRPFERLLKQHLKWRVRAFEKKKAKVISERLKRKIDKTLYSKYGDYDLVDTTGDPWSEYEAMHNDSYPEMPKMVDEREFVKLYDEFKPDIEREVESSMLREGLDLYKSPHIAEEKTTFIAIIYFFLTSLSIVLLEPFTLPQLARWGFPILTLIVLLVSMYNSWNLPKRYICLLNIIRYLESLRVVFQNIFNCYRKSRVY